MTELLDRPLAAEVSQAGRTTAQATPTGTTSRTTVAVLACDPVTGAGVASQLRVRPALEVLPTGSVLADVVLVVADEVDEARIRTIRAATRRGSRTVLVASTLTG